MSDQTSPRAERPFDEWFTEAKRRMEIMERNDMGALDDHIRALREIERLQAEYAELEGYYHAAIETGVEAANERDRLQRELAEAERILAEQSAKLGREHCL